MWISPLVEKLWKLWDDNAAGYDACCNGTLREAINIVTAHEEAKTEQPVQLPDDDFLANIIVETWAKPMAIGNTNTLRLRYARRFIKALLPYLGASKKEVQHPDGCRKTLRALITAVTYAGVSDLPNDAGKGYMARVPAQFIDDALNALRQPMREAVGEEELARFLYEERRSHMGVTEARALLERFELRRRGRDA